MIWQLIREKLGRLKSRGFARVAEKSSYPLPTIYIEEKPNQQPDGNVVINVSEMKVETVENTQDPNYMMILDHPISNICKRCGRPLKNQKSRELGYGLICYQKHAASIRRRPLFDVKEKGE